MSPAENSLTAGVDALSIGPGAAPVGDAAGARGVNCQYSIFVDGGGGAEGSRLGLGARAVGQGAFDGDSPLYFMLENGLPALREVARLLVRESEPR